MLLCLKYLQCFWGSVFFVCFQCCMCFVLSGHKSFCVCPTSCLDSFITSNEKVMTNFTTAFIFMLYIHYLLLQVRNVLKTVSWNTIPTHHPPSQMDKKPNQITKIRQLQSSGTASTDTVSGKGRGGNRQTHETLSTPDSPLLKWSQDVDCSYSLWHMCYWFVQENPK